MNLHRAYSLIILLCALQASTAVACGFCIEDKIAAVYDHAAVTHAIEQGHEVVFCSVGGTGGHQNDLVRTIKSAFKSIVGVDQNNIRISADNSTVAFTFDPKHASLDQISDALRRRLIKNGLDLAVLRVMKTLAQLERVEK